MSRSSGSSSATTMGKGFSEAAMAALQLHLFGRQGHNEARALARHTVGRDAAAVPLDNLLTDRKADPVAVVLAAAVEPLENREQARDVLLFEADAIVLDRDLAVASLGDAAAHLDHGRHAGTVELERVADEVLQELAHLDRIGVQRGKRSDLDPRPELLDAHL